MTELAVCKVCGKRKKPMGRDAGLLIDSYCYYYSDGDGCEGYNQPPRPTTYWAGECADCDGTGRNFARWRQKCKTCGGSGKA